MSRVKCLAALNVLITVLVDRPPGAQPDLVRLAELPGGHLALSLAGSVACRRSWRFWLLGGQEQVAAAISRSPG
jgi:hypothetical protein